MTINLNHGNRLRNPFDANETKKARVKRVYAEKETKLDPCWPNRYLIKKLIARFGAFNEIDPDIAFIDGFNQKVYKEVIMIQGQRFYSVGSYAFSISKNKNLIVCKI